MSSGAGKIEITQSTLLKLLVRRGSDNERKNITFSEGELGFTVDTQRLFVGDAFTIGGIPASLELYYGAVAPTAYTAALLNDLAFDSSVGALYVLRGTDPTVLGNWTMIAGPATARVDSRTIQLTTFNGVPNTLMVKTISGAQIDPGFAGTGLQLTSNTMIVSANQLLDSINLRNSTALQLPKTLTFGQNPSAAAYSLPEFDGSAGYSLVTNGAGTLQWLPGNAVTQFMVLTGSQIPVGSIFAYGSGGSPGPITPPVGYFICDGTAKLSASYVDLFNVIGTFYGTAGAGTFKLPALTASNEVYIIKYVLDKIIQPSTITIAPTLTALATDVNALITSFTFPNTGTPITIGIADYISRADVESRRAGIVQKLPVMSDPNCGLGQNASSYSYFIDSDNQIRFNGYESKYSAGFGYNLFGPQNIYNSPTVSIEFGDVFEKPAQVYSAEGVTFVLSNSGNVYAAGDTSDGIAGNGSTTLNGYQKIFTKINIPAAAGPVVKISIGGGEGSSTGSYVYRHAFALTQSGSAYGWGHNQWGQLGVGDTTARGAPTLINVHGLQGILLRDIYSFSGNDKNYTFAIDTNNNVYSCGYNGVGQLGNGTTSTSATTGWQVIGKTADKIYGCTDINGVYASTYLLSAGKVWSTGYNGGYNLGINNTTNKSSFTPVSASTSLANQLTGVNYLALSSPTSVASNGATVVALMADGTIKSWGNNSTGACGVGTTAAIAAPTVPTGGSFVNSGVTKIVAVGRSGSTIFALNSAGQIWSSGSNNSGQLGIGMENTNITVFTKVIQPYNITYTDLQVFTSTVSNPSYAAVFALDSNSRMWGWGANDQLQLGFGNAALSLYVPTRINFV